ncbi:hypothetical protein MMPV_005638 [Pyropia vietnamensis]
MGARRSLAVAVVAVVASTAATTTVSGTPPATAAVLSGAAKQAVVVSSFPVSSPGGCEPYRRCNTDADCPAVGGAPRGCMQMACVASACGVDPLTCALDICTADCSAAAGVCQRGGVVPTTVPTAAPTGVPTVAPTAAPTVAPTATPTVVLTTAPSPCLVQYDCSYNRTVAGRCPTVVRQAVPCHGGAHQWSVHTFGSTCYADVTVSRVCNKMVKVQRTCVKPCTTPVPTPCTRRVACNKVTTVSVDCSTTTPVVVECPKTSKYFDAAGKPLAICQTLKKTAKTCTKEVVTPSQCTVPCGSAKPTATAAAAAPKVVVVVQKQKKGAAQAKPVVQKQGVLGVPTKTWVNLLGKAVTAVVSKKGGVVVVPTAVPTAAPTAASTATPTVVPTAVPTASPSPSLSVSAGNGGDGGNGGAGPDGGNGGAGGQGGNVVVDASLTERFDN